MFGGGCVIQCMWASDSEKVVLEMVEEGKRFPTDADPCTWGDLLRDFESAGLVDCTINGHTLTRPTLEDDSGTYNIQVKEPYSPRPAYPFFTHCLETTNQLSCLSDT